MKKIQIIICSLAVAMTLTLASCGGDSSTTGTPADSSGAGKGGDDGKSMKPDVSAEMTEFMGMLKGDAKFTEEALKKYGSEGLDTKNLDMAGLKEPKVVAVQNSCYTMKAKSGLMVSTSILCWEGGKIKSVENKGMGME